MESSEDELSVSVEGEESELSDESDLSIESENSEGSEETNKSKDEIPCESLEQQTEVPKDIEFKCLVVGICFHPKKNLIAAGTIRGPVKLYSYSHETANSELITFEHHKKSCRAVSFSATGKHLFTGSNDASIQVIDLETNSVVNTFGRPDGAPLYSLLPINDYLLASGDDNGVVVIWDFRKQTPIACFEECNEYISSLTMDKEKKILLATSGEGTLSAFNIRSKKMQLQSELFDSEFLSSAIVKDESKLIIGAGDGTLNIFNWGEWGNISDRYPGHPGSVDSMVAIGDDVVCTGCEDGKIRAVQLFPNRFLGVVGNHSGFPVECVIVSNDRKLLASSSYDQKVKFWDLSALEQARTEVVSTSKKNKAKQLNTEVKNFFSGLA